MTTLWSTDKALLIVGVALVAASPLWWPWLLPLGWAALGLGLLAWLGEPTGYERPQAGRTSIVRAGCRPDSAKNPWISRDERR